MKKLLISIIAVSITGTISAGSFSMADYKAKTGNVDIKKVEKKKQVSASSLIITTEMAIEKLKLKIEKLELTRAMIQENFSKRSAKIAELKGDKKSAIASLNTARKTKMNGLSNELARIRQSISDKERLLNYYKRVDELSKVERSLRIAGILKSSVSV